MESYEPNRLPSLKFFPNTKDITTLRYRYNYTKYNLIFLDLNKFNIINKENNKFLDLKQKSKTNLNDNYNSKDNNQNNINDNNNLSEEESKTFDNDDNIDDNNSNDDDDDDDNSHYKIKNLSLLYNFMDPLHIKLLEIVPQISINQQLYKNRKKRELFFRNIIKNLKKNEKKLWNKILQKYDVTDDIVINRKI